jgi:diguanylate cyclase (GGDEF)-like protein
VTRILLLEGDTFGRTLYGEYLRGEGLSVRTEPDYALALAALEREPSDLIVASIGEGQPLVSVLLDEVRRRSPGIDLIALADRDGSGASRALTDGAQAVLIKPVHRQRLALAVARALARQAMLAARPGMVRELELHRMSQRLLEAEGPERVAERLAIMLATATKAARVIVARAEDDGELVPVARIGFDRETAQRVSSQYRDERARAALVRELGAIELCGGAPGYTALLLDAAPLAADTRADAALLVQTATQATALAARYGDAARAEQAFDPLSGLHDAEQLSRVLTEELARARIESVPVSLVAVDVDGFRAVNDRLGHLLGGRALVELARILERSVREFDVSARLDADRFATILVGTDAAGGRGAAERVRRAVEAHLFLVREHEELRMTVSIGVASAPEHGSTSEELLARAEAALAAAKAANGNCVRVTGS